MAHRAEELWPPSGAFTEVSGYRVHYLRKGDGPPLVLLHGASGNLRDFTFRLVDNLAERWDVIAFDRPGNGYSERFPGAHSPHAQADHLRHALRALGVDRATVLGQSMGGAVAVTWACDAPGSVAGLCLVSAPSHRWEGTAGRLYEAVDLPLIGPLLARAYPALASKSLVRDALERIFAPDPVPEGYEEHIGPGLALRPHTVRANAADISRLKPYLIRQAPKYATLPMPIEIVHGRADTIVPLSIHSEPLHRAAPTARLVALEDTGHMPHHTRPEQILAALERLRP
ncbi:MAG: alpha/beta fold hydrolase [Rubricella sp.]